MSICSILRLPRRALRECDQRGEDGVEDEPNGFEGLRIQPHSRHLFRQVSRKEVRVLGCQFLSSAFRRDVPLSERGAYRISVFGNLLTRSESAEMSGMH